MCLKLSTQTQALRGALPAPAPHVHPQMLPYRSHVSS